MGWFEEDVQREGVLWSDEAVLEVAMAKKVGVAVGIVAPGGGGVAVVAGAVAAVEALRAIIAGGAAVGARAGGRAALSPKSTRAWQLPRSPR
jgi:hypothetical protein